jgi:hypothetical protein
VTLRAGRGSYGSSRSKASDRAAPFKSVPRSAAIRQSNRRNQAMPRGGIRSTSFKSGQSGNPAGRPKRPQTIETRQIIADVRAAARDLTQEALNTLVTVMKDSKAPAAARVSAATAILDRGHGRPTHAIRHSGAIVGYDLTKLTDKQLADLEAILAPTLTMPEDDSIPQAIGHA